MEKRSFLKSIAVTTTCFAALTSAAAELVPATFEDLGLAPDSHWCGDVDDPDYAIGTFTSGSFEFSNFYWADYMSWAWFAYANHGKTDLAGMEAQWYSEPGGGHESPGYAVIYYADFIGPTWCTVNEGTDTGQVIPGMWVCNNAWTADFIRNGDGFSTKFSTGDTLTLTVKGTAPDNTETETSILLADCTDPDESKWTMADDWQWMDLSVLGAVSMLEFKIESTKKNQYGDLAPTYCCIDDLGAAQVSNVTALSADSVAVKVSAKGGVLTIRSSKDGIAANLLTLDGKKIATARTQDSFIEMETGYKGCIVVEIVTPHGKTTRKVMM